MELGRRGPHMSTRENIGFAISQTRPEEAGQGLGRGTRDVRPSVLRMISSSASVVGSEAEAQPDSGL